MSFASRKKSLSVLLASGALLVGAVPASAGGGSYGGGDSYDGGGYNGGSNYNDGGDSTTQSNQCTFTNTGLVQVNALNCVNVGVGNVSVGVGG